MAEDDFELLNLLSLLLSDGITGIHHCAWFIRCRRLNPGPGACQMSSLITELPPQSLSVVRSRNC